MFQGAVWRRGDDGVSVPGLLRVRYWWSCRVECLEHVIGDSSGGNCANKPGRFHGAFG